MERMIDEISQRGPMTFARFMELALYDGEHGYYMTPLLTKEGESSGTPRIGWGGDFYTAPELSPLFAGTMVRQLAEIDQQWGSPSSLTFIEMGGGTGAFARDFLRECQGSVPELFERLTYHIVERSPQLQGVQRRSIEAAFGPSVQSRLVWSTSLTQENDESVNGVIFSNELVDALPVHRVKGTPEGLQEVLVDYENGRFVERLGPLSSPRVAEYVKTQHIVLEEGQTSEIHVEAAEWMREVARVLNRGVVITVDYGHPSRDYYSASRKDGTFLCYYRHQVTADPYIRIGQQDMTAHVNFSALASIGTECGLETVGFTTLANWLMGLRVEELVQGLDEEAPQMRALAQLLHPHGMGKTFKVLVQQKGLGPLVLSGLQFRAFFDDVL